MKKVLILVEGQTEETFVKRILAPYLVDKDIHLIPRILVTKEVKDGPNFKGGMPKYEAVKGDILRLLGDSSASAVTTMFDYYGLKNDFPGFVSRSGDCYNKVKQIEEALLADINDDKFIPYIQLHEFEALLFSSPEAITDVLGASAEQKLKIKQIKEEINNPEEINERPNTCPSKRILDIFPEYTKVLYGSLISGAIGVGQLKKECKHFNSWVVSLEV